MALLALAAQRLTLVLIFLVACAAQTAAAEGFNDPYQVKAAFLYNFAKFVEWPPEAFKDATDRISICVLGKNPFGSSVVDAVEGKTIGGRKLKVSSVSTAAEARVCHILFVVESHKTIRGLLEEVKSPYVLTVGESQEFLASGGVINLKVQDSRVRIEINRKAAGNAKFRISSKLLSLAAEE